MATQSNYHRNGNHSFYHSLPPISREMGPPLDYPLQPMDIDLSSSRTMLSQGFGDLSYASTNIAKMARIDGYTRPQDPITQWYTGNDGPWNPHKVIPEILENRLPSKHSYRYTHPLDLGLSFQYNVPHSDSGYGTRRSVGNTSVLSVDQDCQSLTSHVTDYHHSFHGMNEVIHQRDARVAEVLAEPSDLPIFVCYKCGKSVKTQSELKNHDLRHTKPFVCQVHSCSRTEGFSTSNDLDRHTKSKHPSAIIEIPTKRFRCFVPGCKSKEKSWPRLDNFRCHLKRVHLQLKEDSFDDMVKRAESWETPLDIDQDFAMHVPISQPRIVDERNPDRERRHGVVRGESTWKPLHSEIIESMRDLARENLLENQTLTSMEVVSEPMSHVPEMPQEEVVTVQPEDNFQRPSSIPEVRTTLLLSSVSKSGLSDPTSCRDKAARQTLASDASVTEVIKSVLAGFKSSERIDNTNSDRSVPSGKAEPRDMSSNDARTQSSQGSTPSDHSDSPLSGSIHLKAQMQAVEVIRALRKRGFEVLKKTPVAEPEGPQNLGSAAGNKSEHHVICQTCKKFKGRLCELKKHMKRHERPYGCTFLTCRKTFGSKNDWKRHENSQHIQLETWRCDEVLPESEGSTVCGKVCYRKQKFQEHLDKAHATTSDEQKDKLDTCRIRRNCQSQFWCGFCDKIVPHEKNGLDAWMERFDHIDDHFMGRHGRKAQSILDWTPVDDDKSNKSLDIDTCITKDTRVEAATTGSVSSKRNRTSGEIEESPKRAKHAKNSADMITLTYCCQCNSPHNPKLHQSCISCTETHVFCDACVVEYAEN